MDNNTIFIKSVIAHTIILHASMNPNVSPLTTLLHRLETCQNMYILSCISDTEAYVLSAILEREIVTRYICECGYKYVIGNSGHALTEQRCPGCKVRMLGGTMFVLHAGNKKLDENPLRSLVTNDISGYIGETPNQDIGYCVRSMPPTSFRILHLFVHILIGASSPSTIATNFLQKNNQVATNTEHYCLEHIQNDWNILKQILNCSDENLALTLHSILANMTQNPPPSSNLNTPDQREEWETQFTRNYVSDQIKSIIETTTNFRTRLNTASTTVQGNTTNVIESEINQTLTTFDISQLPRLWRKIGVSTFESFRAYYNGNLAQYKEQFPVLAVYFKHEESLRYVKHLWDIVKFVQLVSARLSYRLNREKILALTFREYFLSEKNEEALMTAYKDFEKAWNSVIDNVDRYECHEIVIKPKMHFDQKLTLALIEPKDEGVYLCAILEYLIFIQNKFLEEIMTITPGTCRSLGFLEDSDSFTETEGPPQYYIQSLTLKQLRKDNLISYQWEDDCDRILQFSERNLGVGRGQDIIYDLQKIEQELARYLIYEKVHIEKLENSKLFMELFSYHMELFQSSMKIIEDIRNLIPQEPISAEKASAIVGIPTNSFNLTPGQMDSAIDNPSDILSALEILLCFVKRSPGSGGEFSIKGYVSQWASLSKISENAKFNSLLTEDLKLKHLIGLYELIEEQMANITVKNVSEKYKAPITNDLVDSLNKVIDWTIPPSQQELLPAKAFALALKRFMYRFLQGETMNENELLELYVCNESLYFWPSSVSQELIDKLFPGEIMVSHTYNVYEFITNQIENLIRRQHQQQLQ
ncbi:8472_t:CDS:2, partial [Diversispora eburnea]